MYVPTARNRFAVQGELRALLQLRFPSNDADCLDEWTVVVPARGAPDGVLAWRHEPDVWWFAALPSKRCLPTAAPVRKAFVHRVTNRRARIAVDAAAHRLLAVLAPEVGGGVVEAFVDEESARPEDCPMFVKAE